MSPASAAVASYNQLRTADRGTPMGTSRTTPPVRGATNAITTTPSMSKASATGCEGATETKGECAQKP
jgi:hypothetical protein